MGDVNWTVRASEEIKAKITGMVENSGLPSKDFLEAMITAYEMQQVKDHRSELTQDLDELEKLTRRICSIYIGMAERIDTALTDKNNKYSSDMAEKIAEINEYKAHVKEVINECETLKISSIQLETEKAEIKKNMESLQNKIQELEASHKIEIDNMIEANNTSKGFIQELQKGKKALEIQLSEYETYKKQVQELQAELKEAYVEIEKVNAIAKDMENKLNNSKDKINHIEERHKQETENIRRILTQEKAEALLQQKESLNNHIQELRDKHNAEIDKYNSKVKLLLDEQEARQKVLTDNKQTKD